jgi:hypothetical protein
LAAVLESIGSVVRSDGEGTGTEQPGPSRGQLADVLNEIRVSKDFPSHISPVPYPTERRSPPRTQLRTSFPTTLKSDVREYTPD